MTFKDFVKTAGKTVGYLNPVTATATAVLDKTGAPTKAYNAVTNKSSTPQVQGVSYEPGAYPGAMYYDQNSGQTMYNNGSAWVPYGSAHETDPVTLGSSTYGSSSYDPYAAQKSTLKSHIQDKFKTLQTVFDGLFGNIDKSYADKANELNTAYDKQNTDLADQFNNTLGQTNSMYAARGLSDSSYLGDKIGQITADYTKGLDQIGQNRTTSMADLGRNLTTTKAGLNQQRNAYSDAMNNLDQYDVNGLSSLENQLGTAVGNAQTSAAGYMSNPEYVSRLASVAPAANAGTGALAAQLQSLVTSSAPIFAKKQIAQGLIRRAQLSDPNAQSYWGSYFQDLLNKNGVA